MCECIEKVNIKLKEANTNTALDVPMMLSFSDNQVKADKVSIKTRKIDSKKRGKAQTIMSAFCPFCGIKY